MIVKLSITIASKMVQPLNSKPFLLNFLSFGLSKFNCNHCSKRMETPQCKACDRMVNYFQIFNIPQKYAIDPKTVRDMAKDLQKEFHPDKFNQNASTSLQQKMAKYSTYINEAKATLLNDLQRAIYLMELKGVTIKQEIDTVDSQFMMDIFQINEAIESSELKEAQQIKMRIDGILLQLQKDLQDFFQSEDLQKCKQFVVKYKYLHSALINVKKRISELQDKSEGQ